MTSEIPSRLSSEKFRELYGGGNLRMAHSAKAEPKGIYLQKEKMSKVERQYGQILEIEFRATPNAQVLYEAISLRLPSGTRYCPDWVVMQGNIILLMVETKGAYRLGSAGASHEKFKAACAAYSAIRFRYAKKNKDGWAITESETKSTP